MLSKREIISISFKLAGWRYALLIFFAIALTIGLLLFTQGLLKGYEHELVSKIIGGSPHVSIKFSQQLDEQQANQLSADLEQRGKLQFTAKGLVYSGTADIFSDQAFDDNWVGTSRKSQSPEIVFKGMQYTEAYVQYLSKILISFEAQAKDKNQNNEDDLAAIKALYIEQADRKAWDAHLQYRKPIAFPPSLYRELLNPYAFYASYPYLRLTEAEKNFGIQAKALAQQKIEFVVVASLDMPLSDETISIVSAYETIKYLINGTAQGDDFYNYIELYLTDPMQATSIAKVLRKQLGEQATISVWSDKYVSELALITAFNVLLYSVMLGIGISIGLLLSSLLGITVRRKSRQIAVLLAMGSGQRLIVEIFIYYSLFIGFIAYWGGVIIASGLSYGLSYFVNAQATAFNDYPLLQLLQIQLQGVPQVQTMGLLQSSIILIVVLIICFISAYQPAKKGANINPIEGLK